MPQMISPLSIRFFDKYGEYAGRSYFHAPRVGDEIMLNAGRRYVADTHGKAAFLVKRVVWGVEGPNDHCECVNIEIEALSPEIDARKGGDL